MNDDDTFTVKMNFKPTLYRILGWGRAETVPLPDGCGEVRIYDSKVNTLLDDGMTGIQFRGFHDYKETPRPDYNNLFNSAKPKCTYCKTERDTVKENCRNCGAP